MEANRKPGAQAELEIDRATVERFREAFPNARWDDLRRAWWVPGKTAERRIARWRAIEQGKADVHADAKGRDAYAFDPIVSVYLEPGQERTVVEELRQVPYARWDDVRRAWVVPYQSFEELRRRWPEIEAAAKRNEPYARRARREAAKGTEAHAAAQERNAERRKRRYPVPVGDPPPLGRPVATAIYGIVVFTDSAGELVDPLMLSDMFPELTSDDDFVWATWRLPTLQELVEAWPTRAGPDGEALARGWWQPVKLELVEARRSARSRERRRNHG